MATIVFTAIGSAIGGPVGALIGSVIGQQIDNAVLGSGKRREGPRIKELSVQTSSYGTQVPAIFGAMRVAGTVIWSTDLIEKRSSTSGGKGQPSTVNYSYSVSMAVALSSRPIDRVGRIWAEGNLIRGAQGDFKVETGFRFHAGHFDQARDPLISSAEGAANSPAYRGLSYAVFENLQLSEFGNRIPSMTFELFERDGSVSITEICSAASGSLIVGTSAETLSGYAVQGDSASAAIAPLLDAFGTQIRPAADKLQLYGLADTGAFGGDTQPVLRDDEPRSGMRDQIRISQRKTPVSVALRYYDPQRDYQAGMQRSGWSVTGQIDEQLDLPAVLDASSAQQIAQQIALRRHLRRDGMRRAVAIGSFAPIIGQSIDSPSLRVIEIEHFMGYSLLNCERTPAILNMTAASAEPGRHQPSPDQSIGQTLLEILELPSLGASVATAPLLALAAGGTGPGWRRAVVSRNLDAALIELGQIEIPSAIGVTLNPVTEHTPNLIDDFNVLQIRIDSNSEPPILTGSSPLVPSAPALMLGNELIRFGAIEAIGGNMFVLRNLVRDVAKTGSSGHSVGTRVVFLDKDRLLFPDWGILPIGTEISVQAWGLADAVPVVQEAMHLGHALLPLSPVHVQVEGDAAEGLSFNWIRRARHDPGWADGVDLPIVESANRYLCSITHNGFELFASESGSENLAVSAPEVAAWSLQAGSPLQFSVRQIGDHGLSEASLKQFTL